MWLWVKTNGIPFWGWCTTRSDFFRGDWDVHWGYAILAHGHVCWAGAPYSDTSAIYLVLPRFCQTLSHTRNAAGPWWFGLGKKDPSADAAIQNAVSMYPQIGGIAPHSRAARWLQALCIPQYLLRSF